MSSLSQKSHYTQVCYKHLSSSHWEHSTGTAPVGNELQLSRPSTSPPTPKMHLSWPGRASTLPVQLSRDGRVLRAHEALPSTTENATEAPSPRLSSLAKHILNILVLPLRMDFGSTKTLVGPQVLISKLSSSDLSPKAFAGERFLEVFCLRIRAFAQFSL